MLATMKPLDSDSDSISYAGYTEIYVKLDVLDKIKKGQALIHEWTKKGKPKTNFNEEQIDLLAWAQVPFLMSNYHTEDPMKAIDYINTSFENMKKSLLSNPKINKI